MGLSSHKAKKGDELVKEYKSKQFFNAYLSIKNILYKNIYPEKDISNKEVYLINTSSIINFIKKLIDKKIFEDFQKNQEIEINEKEVELKEDFQNFDLKEVNPKINSYYPDCKEILETQEENEFIIVDKYFIRNFKIKDAEYKYVNIINISKINNNYCIKIKFPIFDKVIIAEEKQNNPGFFEFTELEGNKENEIKIKEILISEDRENEEEKKKFESMIKSICYCLINIKSFKNYFFRIGFKIKEDNNSFHKIFFDMIQQNNVNNECFSNLIKNINKDTLVNIINNIYNKLHEEELVLENSEVKIKEMFYFTITNPLYNCQNCGMISQKGALCKSIEFPLKAVLNFKNGNKQLNIFDCFDFWSNYPCQNCKIQIKNFSRMELNNEILTIILNRGNNFEDDIEFNLDYDINLDQYLEENCKNKYNYKFELKGFLSYYPDKKEFHSFYKNINGNNWCLFNGSNINQFNNINDKNCLGFPVLLFYKIEKTEKSKINISNI